MVKKAAQMMTFMMMIVFGIFIGGHAEASVVDATPFVDTISTTNKEFYPRETGDIAINFSEKNGHRFHPGDELVFSIPKELKGFSQKMWLEDFAQVRVDNGRVSVKFTGKVQGRTKITGQVKFGVKGSENVPRGSKQTIPLHLGTGITNYPQVVVNGYQADTGVVQEASDFSYKGGNVNDNDVRLIDWYVVVNPNSAQMSDDVIVRDSLGFGHEIVPGSIKLGNETINASHGTLKTDKHSFTLTLKKNYVNGRGVGIYYQTRLTAGGEKNKTLTNAFTTDYQIAGRPKNSISGTAKVTNVLMSGSINGEFEQLHAEELEEVNQDESQHVAPIEEIVADKATESVQENKATNKATKNRVEVHVETRVEDILDESSELGTIEKIVTDKAEESEVEDNMTGVVETKQPEVHVNVVEEENTDEAEELGTVEEIKTDKAEVTEVEDNMTGVVETKQPEVHVNVVEEENTDEAEELGTVEEIKTDKAEVTEVEDNMTGVVETKQPEVHVNVVEEVVVDESNELGTIEEVVTDEAQEVVEGSHPTENVAHKVPETHTELEVQEEAQLDIRSMPVLPMYKEAEIAKELTTVEVKQDIHGADVLEEKQIEQSVSEGDTNDELPMTGSRSNYVLVFVGMLLMFGLVAVRRFVFK